MLVLVILPSRSLRLICVAAALPLMAPCPASHATAKLHYVANKIIRQNKINISRKKHLMYWNEPKTENIYYDNIGIRLFNCRYVVEICGV